MTKQDLLERVGKLPDDEEYAATIWSHMDILDRAEERGIKISEERAKEIIREVNSRQDASIGINWDVIDSLT